MAIESVGIVGYGEFGPVAEALLVPDGAEVWIHDKKSDIVIPKDARRGNLVTVSTADVVFITVPFDSYKTVLPEVAEHTRPETLIVDFCSVKVKPSIVFKRYGLKDRPNVLMAHPLFGPQSIARGVNGKNMVCTEQTGVVSEELVQSWSNKGLNIARWKAWEHDLEMAKVHALTFFVGRTLFEMGITPSPLNTPYFSELLDLIEVERHHSPELFDTIQRHNPFARKMRQDFLDNATRLHSQFDKPRSR